LRSQKLSCALKRINYRFWRLEFSQH
jgi:hypothetical protein